MTGIFSAECIKTYIDDFDEEKWTKGRRYEANMLHDSAAFRSWSMVDNEGVTVFLDSDAMDFDEFFKRAEGSAEEVTPVEEDIQQEQECKPKKEPFFFEGEEFRDIPGFEGYKINKSGEVRGKSGGILKYQYPCSPNLPYVTTSHGSKPVEHLLTLAFGGGYKKGPYIFEGEEYNDIRGYEGYKANRSGDVISFWGKGGASFYGHSPRRLSPTRSNSFELRKNKKKNVIGRDYIIMLAYSTEFTGFKKGPYIFENEEYNDIPGFFGYKISRCGDIISFFYGTAKMWRVKPEKLVFDKSGKKTLRIYSEQLEEIVGQKSNISIKRLLELTYPDGYGEQKAGSLIEETNTINKNSQEELERLNKNKPSAPEEEFRDIPGFEGYKISRSGKVIGKRGELRIQYRAGKRFPVVGLCVLSHKEQKSIRKLLEITYPEEFRYKDGPYTYKGEEYNDIPGYRGYKISRSGKVISFLAGGILSSTPKTKKETSDGRISFWKGLRSISSLLNDTYHEYETFKKGPYLLDGTEYRDLPGFVGYKINKYGKVISFFYAAKTNLWRKEPVKLRGKKIGLRVYSESKGKIEHRKYVNNATLLKLAQDVFSDTPYIYDGEEYNDIPGYENYKISRSGKIISFKHSMPRMLKIIDGQTDLNGKKVWVKTLLKQVYPDKKSISETEILSGKKNLVVYDKDNKICAFFPTYECAIDFIRSVAEKRTRQKYCWQPVSEEVKNKLLR